MRWYVALCRINVSVISLGGLESELPDAELRYSAGNNPIRSLRSKLHWSYSKTIGYFLVPKVKILLLHCWIVVSTSPLRRVGFGARLHPSFRYSPNHQPRSLPCRPIRDWNYYTMPESFVLWSFYEFLGFVSRLCVVFMISFYFVNEWLLRRLTTNLKTSLFLKHSRHRSSVNFCVNLLCGLIAYCHQPQKPSLHFDWLLPPSA